MQKSKIIFPSLIEKNGHFQIVALEKTFENPLSSKEIKPVNPKGNHSLNIEYSLEEMILKLTL